MARSDHSDRSPQERVQRLRERLRDVKPPNTTPQLIGILHGLLDLVADELGEKQP